MRTPGLTENRQESPEAAASPWIKPQDKPRPSGDAAPGTPVHISVCVCTFKRPALLADLLQGLLNQTTDGQFTFSIVVVDNDREASARETVERFQQENPGMIGYFVEKEQNIALARNCSVARAKGEFVAFIDDDETPIGDWLLKMYAALMKFGVDGVLGPVESRFAVTPPEWMVKARIFDRPNGPGIATGSAIDWRKTGTGNVLLRRRVLDEVEGPFKSEFGSGGEDVDFFRRAAGLGRVFVWCDEATVYEMVPAERTRISFQLRRALLRGKVSLSQPSGRGVGILKSLVASAVYTILLPVFLLLGWHVFVAYLIKDCDHIGKLLAVCRIDLVREKYVVK